MKNFEKAQAIIEELKQENHELKKRIHDLSKSDINNQVDSGFNVENSAKEAAAAMKRFTERLRNDIREYKEKQNVEDI